MKTVTFNGGKITKQIPETWQEVTDEQHAKLMELIFRSVDGELDLYDIRIMFTIYVLAYEPTNRLTKAKRQQVNLTIHQLSEAVDFFYKFNPDKINFEYVLDEQPRPACKLDGISFVPGAFFKNLTCEQFADAFEYYNAYLKTQNDEYKLRMLGVIYRHKPYSTDYAKHTQQKIDSLPSWTHTAGLHYFSSNMQYIATDRQYQILFSGTEEKTGKINQGMAATIYEIMDEYKIGLQEVRNYLFPEYLEILLRQRMKYIRELKAMGKTEIEIAEATGLGLDKLSLVI